MTEDAICRFGPADLTGRFGEHLLALNNAHARELSWLEADQLVRLVGASCLALQIGNVAGFLLAFDQDASYGAGNFLWFRARHTRFVYIDRVVVAAAERSRGHARRLYEAAFTQASDGGHDRIACEVNLAPPNPVSDAFHAALGFAEVGRAVIDNGDKTVRYLLRGLP
jgi:predicted GNAT superfamily acetyltransferase